MVPCAEAPTATKAGRRGDPLAAGNSIARSLITASMLTPRLSASASRRRSHASVATVLDRYGHLLLGTEERVNDSLDQMTAEARQGSRDPQPRICWRIVSSSMAESFARRKALLSTMARRGSSSKGR